MIGTLISKKAFDEFYNTVKKRLISYDRKSYSSKEEVLSALKNFQTFVANWCQESTFNDHGKAKKLDKIYLDLEISLTAKKFLEGDEKQKKVSTILNLLNDKNLVILGDPGAGKTTTLKYLSHSLLYSNLPELKDYNFPFVIELRSLQEDEGIYSYIAKKIGVYFETAKDLKESIAKELTKNIVIDFLNSFKVLLLIDGLDEIDYRFNEILSEYKDIAMHLNNSLAIITCRSGAFSFFIENASVYELCPLGDTQIENFAKKWFDTAEDARVFMLELRRSPYYDTAIRPLLLTQLCILFSKNIQIPNKPKSVYKRIIQLLLEDWDLNRGIKRSTKYSSLELDRKIEFLSLLSFQLNVLYKRKQYLTRELKTAYDFICEDFGFSKKQNSSIIEEIESHDGLIIKAGYDKYQFSHKSLQEYLAANHIIHLPSIPENIEFSNFKNEFAVAIALSSSPNDYFANLIFGTIFKASISEKDIIDFLVRLFFEKPDFNKSSIWLIVVLAMYDKYINGNKFSKKEVGYHSDEEEYKVFINLKQGFNSVLDLIYKEKNLIECYKNISDYYNVYNSYTGDISLTKLSSHLSNQFTFPDRILVSQYVVNRLFR